MNGERIQMLEERARKHAALADALRLQVVDLLSFGDLSPLELQAELNLPSNLVAHHLNVLDRAGIVIRTRSEGDGRRTYVRLDPASLSDLGSLAAARAGRVVFVCSANSARSQLAQALWNASSEIPAVSAGTHPADRVAPGAVATAERHGLDLTAAVPRLVDDLVTDGDYVITVCDRAHEELGRPALHWSVPDPVPTGTPAGFDAAFDDLARRVGRLAPQMQAVG